MQKNSAIILMGIKHSGKSTLGKLISEHFNVPFIDIDDEITNISGKTPREIYIQNGPSVFLQKEEEACKKIADEYAKKSVVISTGGGICDNPPALNFLRPLGTFLYIKTSEKIAFSRIIKKAERLPDGTWKNLPAWILKASPKNEEQIKSIFHNFYEERTEKYKQIADLCITVDAESKKENAEKLISALNN